MRITKIWPGFILPMILFSSCFERFSIGNETDFKPKLVIAGTLTNEDREQEIVISSSSFTELPQFDPLSGCTVFVEDQEGNRFPFHESEAGHYRGTIDGYYIIMGMEYRLEVITPGGQQYRSDPVKMVPTPPVSNVYYELSSVPTPNPDIREEGLQFYLDFSGDEQYSPYHRWELEETYEYHASFPLERWIDDEGSHDIFPDYSEFVCYKTETIQDIFVLSTKGLSQNKFTKLPLHFVNDHTQRLLHRYSLLVRQYSLSESLYTYWKELKKNNKEYADLFGRQPANVKGNIHNVNDASEVVLGFFGASAVSEKRIMVNSVEELAFDQVPYCKAIPPSGPLPPDRPLYFARIPEGGYGLTNPECIFCTLSGGTTEKPSYWDQE